MKAVLYTIIIMASLIAPVEKADVAELEPIEAVFIRSVDRVTEIYTDTGAKGSGENAEVALQDLILNTPGVVYLDTAKYLLVDEACVENIELLRDNLKGNVRLCIWDGNDCLDEVVRYLNVHGNLPKLKNWQKEQKLPRYISKIG